MLLMWSLEKFHLRAKAPQPPANSL